MGFRAYGHVPRSEALIHVPLFERPYYNYVVRGFEDGVVRHEDDPP